MNSSNVGGDPHAYDFMQYAYLQLGEDRKAKELMKEVGATTQTRSEPPKGFRAARSTAARHIAVPTEAEAQSDARIDVVALDLAVGQSAIHFREH